MAQKIKTPILKLNNKKIIEKIKETDLYLPIAKYLEHQGYQVNSEVKNCDITAIKRACENKNKNNDDDELLVVELKTRFSLALVYQALERKRVTESVYVAVPITGTNKTIPNQKRAKNLLRQLQVGLIVVRFMKNKTRVEVISHPRPYDLRHSPKRRQSIIREIDGRYGEFNKGGSANDVEKITTYKLEAIRIAWLLSQSKKESLSPKELREAGCGSKTQQILANNFYGWFNRVSRGLYELDTSGREALKGYQKITGKIPEPQT